MVSDEVSSGDIVGKTKTQGSEDNATLIDQKSNENIDESIEKCSHSEYNEVTDVTEEMGV